MHPHIKVAGLENEVLEIAEAAVPPIDAYGKSDGIDVCNGEPEKTKEAELVQESVDAIIGKVIVACLARSERRRKIIIVWNAKTKERGILNLVQIVLLPALAYGKGRGRGVRVLTGQNRD